MPLGMQSFVHQADRVGSPQPAPNGQPTSSNRRAIAANAKVSMKKGPATQQPQLPIGIPSRGFGSAQNSSAVVRPALNPGRSSQDNKVDLYETDAESIDTTVNQSVIQSENTRVKKPQSQEHNGVADIRSEESDGDEEESEGDDDDEADDDGEIDPENFVITQEDSEFLQREGQAGLSREQAVQYLLRARSEGFRTVEGDSYPSTTDGEPTEWRGEQEQIHDEKELRSSVQRIHRNPYSRDTGQTIHNSQKLFKQGADLRVQQRASAQLPRHLGQGFPPKPASMQSNQPPSYFQASRHPTGFQVFNPHHRSHHQVAFIQPENTVARPQPDSTNAMVQVPTRNTAVPVIQHFSPIEQEPGQDAIVSPLTDYEPEVLYSMAYDQLKNESFDTDPRLVGPPLSDDMRQKSLIEQLVHVQKNFEPTKQSDFFRALPTAEWEEAGDWFLDQFSSIIQRTKQARQQKRKLAQGFEEEVEKRYKHVGKKQQHVENAMQKMQAQGEGLVPRSPKPSKSPKPRKR